MKYKVQYKAYSHYKTTLKLLNISRQNQELC